MAVAMPDPLSSDHEIISRLDASYRRPLMRFFMRRVVDASEAEDLTQQVFLRLLGTRDVRQIEHADAFIFTIASNLLRDRQRQGVRRGLAAIAIDEAVIAEVAEELIDVQTPERVLIGRQTLADVMATLNELDERTRDMFILFRLEHMKQHEISELYGVSLSTVERSIVKAATWLLRKYGPSFG